MTTEKRKTGTTSPAGKTPQRKRFTAAAEQDTGHSPRMSASDVKSEAPGDDIFARLLPESAASILKEVHGGGFVYDHARYAKALKDLTAAIDETSSGAGASAEDAITKLMVQTRAADAIGYAASNARDDSKFGAVTEKIGNAAFTAFLASAGLTVVAAGAALVMPGLWVVAGLSAIASTTLLCTGPLTHMGPGLIEPYLPNSRLAKSALAASFQASSKLAEEGKKNPQSFKQAFDTVKGADKYGTAYRQVEDHDFPFGKQDSKAAYYGRIDRMLSYAI